LSWSGSSERLWINAPARPYRMIIGRRDPLRVDVVAPSWGSSSTTGISELFYMLEWEIASTIRRLASELPPLRIRRSYGSGPAAIADGRRPSRP